MRGTSSDSDRRILIASDGSRGSRDALRLGKQLCEIFDATALVASCVVLPRWFTDPDLKLATTERTAPLFDAAERALDPIPVETCNLFDESAGRALVSLSEEKGPFAMVVGSSSHGPVGRVLHGSVGRALLTGAPCPVAIAPRGYSDEQGEHLLRIAVAIDGGSEARRALDEAVSIAQRIHATLTIITVVGPPPIVWGATPGYSAVGLGGLMDRYAEKLLADAAHSMPEGLPVTTRQLEGDPAAVLAATSSDFDLLVVGSRGYGPVRRVLAGSTTDRLSRTARCPLFVVPRGAGQNDLDRTELAATAGTEGNAKEKER